MMSDLHAAADMPSDPFRVLIKVYQASLAGM